jgi:PHD/YefM family antitoxin component YafN of YafNO toxin-antitoxin module
MSNFITYRAEDVTDRLGELLDEASASPIRITMHERLMAYIVSSSDYEAMLERIQFLEDQLWLGKAGS